MGLGFLGVRVFKGRMEEEECGVGGSDSAREKVEKEHGEGERGRKRRRR